MSFACHIIKIIFRYTLTYFVYKKQFDMTKLKDIDMASIFKNFGGVNVIYTDISKDGMMTGVNFDAIKKLVNLYPELKIVASGGISSIGDIIKCKTIGCDGVIIGKAYYTGKINIRKKKKKC